MALITEHLHACGLVEASWVKAQAASFPRHTHDEYVLSANLQGDEHIWLDGRSLDVNPGQVTVYNPLAVQGSAFGPSGVEYISLHLAPQALARVIAENNLDHPNGCPSFDQGVLQHPGLFQAIVDFARVRAQSPEEDEEALINLLNQLLEQPSSTPGEQRSAVLHTVQFMREHLWRRLELNELARIARLSKYHFVRCFKKATGLAPLQYHMQLRLSEARRHLRGGLHPQEVAATLGFYDQSHFINAFRRTQGLTPHTYWMAHRAVAGTARINSR